MKTLLILLMIASVDAFAEVPAPQVCSLTVNREACLGKEQEALAPYNGVNPTTERPLVRDKEDCLKRANTVSRILRKRIIKKIEVTPSYNGQLFAIVMHEDRCNSKKKKIRVGKK